MGWTRIILTRKETHPANIRPLQIIERNAAAQAAMIDDILDVARIVTGKLRLDIASVDLAPVVMAAVDVITPSARAKRIDVRAELDEQAPRVLGDAGRLQQIVWNLLSNAVKFSEAGGEVVVTVASTGEKVRIEVRDTGHGISPEFLPYVFDRFRQSDASSARRQGGLGLGLALVRDLVHLHGGTVRVESGGEHTGAVFTIELPALPYGLDAGERGDNAAAKRADDSTLDGIRVLVVEDETDSRELFRTVLEKSGADVVAVGSSVEALQVMATGAFDVIVSDLGMPLHDGFELIRRLRASPDPRMARLPAIAVTGYATPMDRERSKAAGYTAHIAKPIDPSVFAVEVLRAINGSGGTD